MERPRNSRVRHGMQSCARYGCKREECLEAERRAHRDTYRNLRNGIQLLVPAGDAHAHAGLLVRAGMSPTDIAEVSGVAVTRVKRVIQDSGVRVRRDTRDAILGVRVPPCGWKPRTDGLADSTGTLRRLRALAVQGFPLSHLSARSGLTVRTIADLRSGLRPRLFISNMRTVTDMHDEIWDLDPVAEGVPLGSVIRAKNWAAKQKWWPTEAWEDIDDPACEPSLKTPRCVILTEDYRELASVCGCDKKQAAERLGVSVNTLDKAISYYDAKKEGKK